MSIAAQLAALTGALQDNGVSSSLSTLEGEFVSIQGALGELAATAEPLSGSFSGLGNFDGAISAQLEALTARLYSPNTLAGDLPALATDFTVLNGGIGGVAAQLSLVEGSFAGSAPQDGSLVAALRPLEAVLGGFTDRDGALAGSIRDLRGEFAGIGGTVAVLAGTLEEVSAALAGAPAAVGTMAGALEPLYLDAIGAQAVESAFRGWAMNSRLGGVTEYTSFPYNSLARYNGAYLGASATSLVRLAGLTDDGQPIAWAVRTGLHDDGKPGLKRLPEVLMGLRADGSVKVTVWKDEEESYEYTLVMHRPDLLHQARVKCGRGLRSRYFRVGVSGSGPSLELDSLQLPMTETTRRLG